MEEAVEEAAAAEVAEEEVEAEQYNLSHPFEVPMLS